MIDKIGTLRWIKRTVDQIFALVNSILTLQDTGGTLVSVVAGGEQDIYRVETPMGVFKPLCLKIDTTVMAAGDSTTIRVYERIRSGGGLVLSGTFVYAGVQAIPMKTITLDPNRHGVQVTLDQTVGVTKNYVWAVMFEV